ncbi:FAD-binding domain-containing protein [Aureobasidium subglaciale]|nr:FAD-binding domain-containing protein [Aureobasidium subglaciale]
MKSASGLMTILAVSSRSNAMTCKSTPLDSDWPPVAEWGALNGTLRGALLQTRPVASACYPGNPFNSTMSCNEVEDRWNSTYFHATLPESVDFSLWTNNSCVPPGIDGHLEDRPCSIGAYPAYIVNGSSSEIISDAMSWASCRNIRINVKGTGHDLDGRSTGAHSLSIWTHHLNSIKFESNWNGTEDVVIVGSGQQWGNVYDAAAKLGKVVVGGADGSVGLGGHIQGGGYGPRSPAYGLAPDQVLQVTVVTTTGETLFANDTNHQDLLWAIRGGGGGTYGVVTEYVLKVYPAPANTVAGILSISGGNNVTGNATWDAFAVALNHIPDLMDNGVWGNAIAFGQTPGEVQVTFQLSAYNSTASNLTAKIRPIIAAINRATGNMTNNSSLSVQWSDPTVSLFDRTSNSKSASNTAGVGGLETSRLLGHAQLTLPYKQVSSYLRRIMYTGPGAGRTMLILGLFAGPGVQNTSPERQGAVNPIWRSTYIHAISGSGPAAQESDTPAQIIKQSSEWYEAHREAVWREWAPNTGAYMNEANPYNSNWKHDFFGINYDRLAAIKQKYDPSESLYAVSRVGSEWWDYDLQTGKLCRIE